MKVAMLFPGYSGQYVGMGKDFYDNHRFVQEYFEEASSCLNLNFVKLCFASSDAELRKIHNAYPSLFLVSTAIAILLFKEGIVPTIVGGYCDGEFAALAAAKCINLPDGLYFLAKYSIFFEELIKKSRFSALHIIGASLEMLQAACLAVSTLDELVCVSISFTSSDFIVSGNCDAVERLIDYLPNKNSIKYESIGIGMGLHSPIMSDTAKLLKMYLEKLDFKTLHTPFINSIDGSIITDGPVIKKLLLQHINQPLDYSKLIGYLKDYDLIVEVGNRVMLHHLLKKVYPNKRIFEVRRSTDLSVLQKIVNSL
jgi:malonyl CoA-acyl carrier protein transacylase